MRRLRVAGPRRASASARRGVRSSASGDSAAISAAPNSASPARRAPAGRSEPQAEPTRRRGKRDNRQRPGDRRPDALHSSARLARRARRRSRARARARASATVRGGSFGVLAPSLNGFSSSAPVRRRDPRPTRIARSLIALGLKVAIAEPDSPPGFCQQPPADTHKQASRQPRRKFVQADHILVCRARAHDRVVGTPDQHLRNQQARIVGSRLKPRRKPPPTLRRAGRPAATSANRGSARDSRRLSQTGPTTSTCSHRAAAPARSPAGFRDALIERRADQIVHPQHRPRRMSWPPALDVDHRRHEHPALPTISRPARTTVCSRASRFGA